VSDRHWPVTLVAGDVTLRPLKQTDARAWREVRRRNAEWLQPWEATLPPEGARTGDAIPTFGMMVRRLRREAREGRTLPFALLYRGALVGQVTLGGIAWGSLRAGYIGYWIDSAVAGRGIMPTAVAMTLDHAFSTMRLHRVEINIRPENAASLRVVEKLGLPREGDRARYLHIDGDWRDHVTFVAYAEDFPGGVLAAYQGSIAPRDTPSG
jgi:ribosomal-protein-alanine N-acetyltransferase